MPKIPFEIEHIRKGETLEAFVVIPNQEKRRIVSLCPTGDCYVVASNLQLTTAAFTYRYADFGKAYTEYYQRIVDFIQYKCLDPIAVETLPSF